MVAKLLSVVTNFYNESKNLTGFMESLRHQTYKDFELVLVDDGSTDNSSQIVKKYTDVLDIKLYKLRHTGLRGARRFGASKAEGKVVMTLDADEIVERHALERVTRYFRDPSVGAVGGCIIPVGATWFNRADQIITLWSFDIRKRLALYRYVFGGCGAYRRTFLESIGGFSTGEIGEDIDASWKMMRRGWKVILDSQIKVWHRESMDFKTYTRNLLSTGARNALALSVYRQKMVMATWSYLVRFPLMFKVKAKLLDKMAAWLIFVVYALSLAVKSLL